MDTDYSATSEAREVPSPFPGQWFGGRVARSMGCSKCQSPNLLSDPCSLMVVPLASIPLARLV